MAVSVVESARQWPTFVISLDPTSERSVRAQNQLANEKITFELFRAIDGTSLHRKRIEDVFDRNRNKILYKYPLSAPEIGCYLSHITLWNRIAHSEEDGAFIFEDDFEAIPGFGDLIRSVSRMASDADVVSFRQSRWPLHRHRESLGKGYQLVEPFIAPPRTTGYAVTKRAASLLYRSALPFARPVDMDMKHWWESGVRYLTVYPTPLIDRDTADSAINLHRAAQKQKVSNITRFVRNVRYQSNYHSRLVAAHWAQRRASLWKQRSTPQATEEVRVFHGHSGCTVTLCRRGSTYFIRKKSASLDYNDRLFGQMQKQTSARRLVRTPRVLGHGYKTGLLYFDMDYVQDSDFFSQIAMKTLDGVGELVDRIIDILENFLVHRDQDVAPSVFLKKIGTVNGAIRRHPFYAGAQKTVDRVTNDLFRAQWDGIPRTECHGDLTLENMLFATDGTITLIDFLDGDLSSGWLDLAKLLYDFESGWSLRARLDKDTLSSEDRLVALLSRYLQEEIRLRAKTKFPNLWERLPQLQLLQAMRVLPYVRDQRTFARVTSFMEKVRVL